MNLIRLRKSNKELKGTLQLPASKSISNRLLIIRALSESDFEINNLSESSDTVLLGKLLTDIKTVRHDQGLTELNTGNAGTAMRFLTAYLAMSAGNWVLTGNARMKHRPIGILVDALKPLGASIEFLGALGYPPLLIKGRTLKGGEIVVDPGISSQFVSALLMVAPKIPGGMILHLSGPPVSYPYVNMTIRLMADFGVNVKRERSYLKIPECGYHNHSYTVEADWSAAAFWYEAAALSGEVDLYLTGLKKESLQGDAVLADLYQCFGVYTEFLETGIHLVKAKARQEFCSFNFADFPDIAPAVITTCAVLGMSGKFSGLKNLKIKETDRVLALQTEYAKMGISIETNLEANLSSGLEFVPANIEVPSGIRFKTYDDHRMAMTFAPLAIMSGEVLIESPEVVEKSYPGFWTDLATLGFEIIN
jgi:3-phosphoshikimate 1-carboxyvinyltransferase